MNQTRSTRMPSTQRRGLSTPSWITCFPRCKKRNAITRTGSKDRESALEHITASTNGSLFIEMVEALQEQPFA